MQDNDAQQQLKKRARRRLVGAAFFASVVALLLPLLMDHDPRPPVQDVAIHIPGQDDKPFAPALVAVPLDGVPDRPTPPPVVEPVLPSPPVLEKKPLPVAKPVEKVPEKPAPEKKLEEPKKPELSDEAKRAAAILSGQFVEKSPAPPVAASGEHVILIGAFSNAGNVKNLQKKLGELGIKTYTEALQSPQGNKTRLRAGPFPNRSAAEKALEKMKRIGVSGVLAPRS